MDRVGQARMPAINSINSQPPTHSPPLYFHPDCLSGSTAKERRAICALDYICYALTSVRTETVVSCRCSSWKNMRRCQKSRYQKDLEGSITDYLQYVIHLEGRWFIAETDINQLISKPQRMPHLAWHLLCYSSISTVFILRHVLSTVHYYCWHWTVFVFYQKIIFFKYDF